MVKLFGIFVSFITLSEFTVANIFKKARQKIDEWKPDVELVPFRFGRKSKDRIENPYPISSSGVTSVNNSPESYVGSNLAWPQRMETSPAPDIVKKNKLNGKWKLPDVELVSPFRRQLKDTIDNPYPISSTAGVLEKIKDVTPDSLITSPSSPPNYSSESDVGSDVEWTQHLETYHTPDGYESDSEHSERRSARAAAGPDIISAIRAALQDKSTICLLHGDCESCNSTCVADQSDEQRTQHLETYHIPDGYESDSEQSDRRHARKSKRNQAHDNLHTISSRGGTAEKAPSPDSLITPPPNHSSGSDASDESLPPTTNQSDEQWTRLGSLETSRIPDILKKINGKWKLPDVELVSPFGRKSKRNQSRDNLHTISSRGGTAETAPSPDSKIVGSLEKV